MANGKSLNLGGFHNFFVRDAGSNPPGFAQGFGSEPVGLFVVYELVLYRIILNFAVEEQSDVGRMTGDVGVAHGISAGPSLAARFDAVEKVAYMEIRRVARDFGALADQQRRRTGDQIAVVGRFDPTGRTFKADGARAELEPAVVTQD